MLLCVSINCLVATFSISFDKNGKLFDMRLAFFMIGIIAASLNALETTPLVNYFGD